MGTAAKPTRDNRTITIDFRDEATYFHLLSDGQAFVEFVFGLAAAAVRKPTVRVLRGERTRRGPLSREDLFSGKMLRRGYVFSKTSELYALS